MPRIKVKLLRDDCKPEKTHKWDAGWDLKALKTVVVPAGGTAKVNTGVIMEIPPHYCGMVFPRSSLGTKHRITLANDVGIIDTEYRGEIMVFLMNNSDVDYEVKRGDRFAQLVVTAINNSDLWVVDRLSETGRGTGGFGSTTEYTMTDSKEQPKVDMTESAKKTAETIDKEIVEKVKSKGQRQAEAREKREEAIAELKKLKPAEYMKLKNSGKLFEIYPIATGDMKEDLGL